MSGKSKKRRRRKQRNRLYRRIILLVGIVVAITLFIICGIELFFQLKKMVKTEVTIEAGQEASIEDFMLDDRFLKMAEILTDMNTVDVNKVGQYEIHIKVRKKEYTSKLIIKDTVPPEGTAKNIEIDSGESLLASDCVENIVDVTNVEVSFEQEPDLCVGGEQNAIVVLKDEGQNITKLPVKINVILDTEPPVFNGLHDIIVQIGEVISYKENITVTDNKDQIDSFEVDNSEVDVETPGKYNVKYTAKDKTGNITQMIITVTVVSGEEKMYTFEMVQEKAKEILAQITNDKMTDMQKAFAIYMYVRTHVGYIGYSDKDNEYKEAYVGLTGGNGDCFTNFAASKALFTAAGIQNMDIKKSDTTHSRHYWSMINLGDGWYHVDCTPRVTLDDYLFMVTDDELEAYSIAHNNSHVFDHSLYPASATKSLQDLINYSTWSLR